MDDQGEQAVVKTQAYLPDGSCRYDLNETGKALIGEFLRAQATAGDVARWVVLLELIWSRLGMIPGPAPAPAEPAVPSPQEDAAVDLGQQRAEFFRRVMDSVAEKIPKFRVPKANPARHWISFGSGPFGNYSVVFSSKGLRVEAYLDMRDKGLTKTLFDQLVADRQAFEKEFGEPLTWERLDGRIASRLGVYREPPDLDDADATTAAVDWAAERCVRFVSMLGPSLRKRASSLRNS